MFPSGARAVNSVSDLKKTAWMDRKALTSKYLSSLMHQTLKVDSYFSKKDKLKQVNNIVEKG
jgi:hypothetical protein